MIKAVLKKFLFLPKLAIIKLALQYFHNNGLNVKIIQGCYQIIYGTS